MSEENYKTVELLERMSFVNSPLISNVYKCANNPDLWEYVKSFLNEQHIQTVRAMEHQSTTNDAITPIERMPMSKIFVNFHFFCVFFFDTLARKKTNDIFLEILGYGDDMLSPKEAEELEESDYEKQESPSFRTETATELHGFCFMHFCIFVFFLFHILFIFVYFFPIFVV